MRKKPNFLIVGAAKAGTTSLAKYLNNHDDIFIPEQKELRFFAKDVILRTNPKDPLLKGILNKSVLNEEEYFKTFDVSEKLAGDASVHYLYHYEEVIPNIKNYIGDIPIIIMLRDPVKRAISNYKFLLNVEGVNSFEKELELEEKRICENYNSFWYYKTLGLYSKQVDAYLKNFTKVKIIIFEEFIKNFENEMNKIHNFLGVNPKKGKYDIFNKSKRYTLFHILLLKFGVIKIINTIISEKTKRDLKKYLEKILISKKEFKIKKELINELYSFYRKDIDNLELIIKRDLKVWEKS